MFCFCSGVKKLVGAQGSPSLGSLLNLLSTFFIHRGGYHDLFVVHDDSSHDEDRTTN